MSKEYFEELTKVFNENKTGLDHIDKHVYLKMFGYKNVDEYYDKVSLDN